MEAAASQDFQNLMAFYSKSDLEEIHQALMRVPIGLSSLTGSLTQPAGNLTLPASMSLWGAVPRRCAIVASSRNVLNGRAGKDIDAVSGPVMRMNSAKTEGYEAFAGGRTEVMLINGPTSENWMARNEDRAGLKMVIINAHKDNRVMKELLRQPLKLPYYLLEGRAATISAVNGVLELIAEKGPASLRRLIKPKEATTGMIGGLLLLNMCREVLHYGFLEAESCQQHYWETTRKCSVDHVHKITREHMLWKIISSTQGTSVTGEGLVQGWPKSV